MEKINTINTFDTLAALSAGFTEFMQQLLTQKAVVNINLSGGSTPKALFDHWAKHEKDSIPWKRLRFFWGDERCVPPSDEMSNFGMTKRHLFDKVPVPAQNIFRILGENDPEQEAVRYGQLLAKELPMADGVPQFDLIILGLGDDAHTASIFPQCIHLWDSPLYCVVAAHPESGMKRVSITGKIINNASQVAFLVTGQGKAEKVRDLLINHDQYIDQYPSARVAPKSGKLYWFMDKAAAGLL